MFQISFGAHCMRSLYIDRYFCAIIFHWIITSKVRGHT